MSRVRSAITALFFSFFSSSFSSSINVLLFFSSSFSSSINVLLFFRQCMPVESPFLPPFPQILGVCGGVGGRAGGCASACQCM